jgi:uncharacterized membrane protein (DUF485 family)
MKNLDRHTVMYSIALVAVFVWIGFVCSISFMEAWLKFRAPNVSLSTGLSIGKLVFAALNKVEWVLGGIVASAIFLSSQKQKFLDSVFLYVPIIILILQTSWLLPSLNERAESIIQGMDISSSSVHFNYLVLEFIKILSLLFLGTCAIYRLICSQTKTS